MSTEGDQSAHAPSSPEVLQSESPPREFSPPPDNEEKGTYVRFLLSNAEAGSVIGKGGSTINEIQSQSGARIQLSRNFEYFPGTSDRIIVISGRIDDILKAVDNILSRLNDEFYVQDGDETVPESKIRLVVPNSSCGGLIGKGGSVIRTLIEDSGARIKVSAQDNYYPGVHDRLVTVSGALIDLMRAVELILLKLVEDQYYHQSANVPFPYAVMYNGMNYGANGAGGKYQNKFPNKVQVQEDNSSSSITIGIADEHIGVVVGRGGRNIMELSQLSGARIKISDRGDFVTGTSDRKVTITGSQRAIDLAESMLMRKIAASVAER